MKLKKSKYNIVIERLDDGQILIYNTFSGIFGIMNKETQEVYENIENINIKEVKDSQVKENIQIMINSGYVIDKEKDELATVKMNRTKAMYESNILTLTIAPTMACNMRCPYCYEDKNGKVMNNEIQKQLIEFIKIQLYKNPNLRGINVSWYGGEPLLKKEIIYKLSKQIIQICEESNILYNASIITNGALLDLDTAKKLFYECKVNSAQITIDGMPEQHNKRRIFADGTGSFEIIVKNIEACKEFFPISVRVNIDEENLSNIKPLANFLFKEKGWISNPKIYLAPVQNYTDYCKQDTSVCIPNLKFAEINREFQNYYYQVCRENVIKGFFPSRKLVFCGAECINNYIIDPEGYCYKCWLVIGNRKYRTGHIGKPFLINSECYKWMSSDIPKDCEQCNYLPMCVGGCPYYRIVDIGKPKCINTYYSYKDTLKLAYYDYINQKNEKKDKTV